ncbi:kelch-like protein 40 [Neocloeon triangulifer]|uniref:kelch-like protein 40 n=1 Tax=Neocloeon triangulifer TaxID=2078957 RepID=UPI00286F11F8|nr:kelch-like protein 40 [Neocloeon triangulifer]XP_059475935.1 kelch-like protein 40 [Neocloeon triangulifer]
MSSHSKKRRFSRDPASPAAPSPAKCTKAQKKILGELEEMDKQKTIEERRFLDSLDGAQRKMRFIEDAAFAKHPEHCSFLVGNQKEKTIFHASKLDLRSASEYFQALLRCEFTPQNGQPIRISHIKPHIFKLVMEYVHTCHLLTPVDLNMVALLSCAADEFLLEKLGKVAEDLMYKQLTTKDVWHYFRLWHKHRFVMAACKQFLEDNTTACLEDDSFLSMNKSADRLVEFLSLEKMNIQSEAQLVAAFAKLASKKGDRKLREKVLPHLRLLLVKPEDLVKISDWLTEEQALFMASQHDPLLKTKSYPQPDSINMSREERTRSGAANAPPVLVPPHFAPIFRLRVCKKEQI